jgi:hypothetical protein
MAKTIKVTCNGAEHHINEIELDKILQPVMVTRSAIPAKAKQIPERSVFHCKFCREGKVVVSREMVEEAAK